MDEREIFLGPRIPKELWEKEKGRFLLPSIILFIAAFILLVSIFMPYWNLTLNAPQYPGGLNIELYVNKVMGDVKEVDGLNFISILEEKFFNKGFKERTLEQLKNK